MGGLLPFPGEVLVTGEEEDGAFKEDGLTVGILVFDGYLIPVLKVDGAVVFPGNKLDFPGGVFIPAGPGEDNFILYGVEGEAVAVIGDQFSEGFALKQFIGTGPEDFSVNGDNAACGGDMDFVSGTDVGVLGEVPEAAG